MTEAMTISTIVAEHYLPEKRRRRRATTVEGYESSLNLHVVPRFGDLTIAEVTRDAIQEWVDSIDLPGAAEKAYKCLRQVIRWAIRKWSLLVIDPTVGVELPRKPVHRFTTLSAVNLAERLRGFWGHPLEPTCIVSSALGLRPGESYALDWADIDMRSGAVDVSKTLQQSRGAVSVYQTKTEKGERVLYLAKWALSRMRDIWRALGRPAGRIIGDLTPSAVAGRIRRFAKKHGLPEVTMQNLRHTWGTLAAEAGLPIETIAMWLGHSSIQMPYEHYIRRSESILKRARDAVEAHMLRAGA